MSAFNFFMIFVGVGAAVAQVERLRIIVTHNLNPLLLTQQGPGTPWASSKKFWSPGNVVNPEDPQDIASPVDYLSTTSGNEEAEPLSQDSGRLANRKMLAKS